MKEFFLPYERKSAWGIVIALFMGVVFFFSLPLSTAILVLPVATAALIASAGWFAGLLAMASSLLVFCFAFDAPPVVLLIIAIIFCLPAPVTVILTKRAKKFFSGMAAAILVQFFLIIAVAAALFFSYGGDVAKVLVGGISGWIKNQSISALLPAVRLLGSLGYFGLNTGIDFASGYISPLMVIELLGSFFAQFEQSLRLTLPSYILKTSITTGGLSYLWVVWICIRRGDDACPDYRSPSTWRMPAHAIIGLPLCMLLTYILHQSGSESMYMVNSVFSALAALMFQIQGACAIDRGYKRRGMPRGRRMLVIVIAAVFVPFLLTLLGIYSAFFGSSGLISGYIKQKIDQNKGDE